MKRSVDLAAALQVLELSHTPENVKRAYRRLSKQRHPDAPGGSHEEFLRLREAYECAAEHMHTKDEQQDGFSTAEHMHTKDEQQDWTGFSTDCLRNSREKEAILFIRFLIYDFLHKKYQDNYKNQNKRNTPTSPEDFIRAFDDPICFLSSAFRWYKSNEGHAFWKANDEKWQAMLRKFRQKEKGL